MKPIHLNLERRKSLMKILTLTSGPSWFSPDSKDCTSASEIDAIVSAWPNLKSLMINIQFPSSRIPAIDQHHFLRLIYGCRHLEKLGLKFNASGINGDKLSPGGALLNESAPLTHLRVLDSPILAPSKVVRFLSRHCPKLKKSLLYLNGDEVAEDSPVFRQIYSSRWSTVARALGNHG